MKSKKILFDDYRNKRIEKFKGLDNPVSKEKLYSLVGDYTFDNFGVSYLDLSEYDFSSLSLDDMANVCFSSSTVWPSKDKLPKGFNPNKILKDCCNVGDEIKKLHEEGLDGEGIIVGVIDCSFQGKEHIEFVNRFNELKKCICNSILQEDNFELEVRFDKKIARKPNSHHNAL